MIRSRGPERVSTAYVTQLAASLSERDWAIVDSVGRLRALTGTQLERLHFPLSTTPRSRSVIRWRALKRLVDARVLITQPHHVYGGSRASHHYTLGSAGQRLVQIRANLAGRGRFRPHEPPSEQFIDHTLATSELYVTLHEQGDHLGVVVERYEVERAAVLPLIRGGWLRPDALCVLMHEAVHDYWWIEVDRATESLPTIRRKLRTYLAFVEAGQLGPDGIVPRVLLTCPTGERCAAILREVEALPEPASVMFCVATHQGAADRLIRELLGT